MRIIKLIPFLIFISHSAYSKDFYAGIDYQTSIADYSSDTITLSSGESFAIEYEDYYEDSFDNFSLFAGFNIEDKYSIEVSYFEQEESKVNNNTGLVWISDGANFVTQGDVEYKFISLEGMKNFNYSDYNITLSPLVGISHIKADIAAYYIGNGNTRSSETKTEKGTAFNFGFQAKYDLANNFFVRAKFRYSFAQDIESLDNIASFNLGVGYSF